jgi:hypothetical protein
MNPNFRRYRLHSWKFNQRFPVYCIDTDVVCIVSLLQDLGYFSHALVITSDSNI